MVVGAGDTREQSNHAGSEKMQEKSPFKGKLCKSLGLGT